jgi:hypothetical protein
VSGGVYLSHPVRRMRENPIEGEEVVLVVEAGDRPADDLASTIQEAGGTVEEHLPFDSLRVTVRQERIDDICAVSGIDSITTDNAIGIGGDAGEDVG